MLRNIDPDGYKQAVWLFSYPGINASQVWFLKFFDSYALQLLHPWLATK